MIIAVSNQKGGVAKTTSTLNLAASLASQSRVLVVDLDPQGACAISLGIDADDLETTIYDVLVDDAAVADIVQPTKFGFDLAPSNIDLAEAELALASIPLREYALRRKLANLPYDVVLIDTPPTLGLLTINAFAAADGVLIPVSTQLLSLRGLSTLLETIDKLKRFGVNDALTVAGIIPTRYDGRTIHGKQVLEYLEGFGAERGIRVFAPVRSTVRFDEAPNEQTPFVLLYPDDPASLIYKEIAHELIAP